MLNFAQVNEPAQPNKCGLEAEVEKEKFEMPSTPQNNLAIGTFGEYSTANVFVAVDSVHTNESDPCLTADVTQNESPCASSGNSIVCINSIKDTNELQPISTEKGKSQSSGSTRRQRKPKCNSNVKTEQIHSVEIKPKRGRTTKSKAIPIKIEQPPELQLNADAIGKCNTQTKN